MKRAMKNPIEFAREKKLKELFDIEMSIGSWNIINQWVKDYAHYFHFEMTNQEEICDECCGVGWYGQDDLICNCEKCNPDPEIR